MLEATPDAKLRQVLMAMSEATRTIAYKVRTASCGATNCVNSFGDEQLAVDLLADKLLFEALKYSVRGCLQVYVYTCAHMYMHTGRGQICLLRGGPRARRPGGCVACLTGTQSS